MAGEEKILEAKLGRLRKQIKELCRQFDKRLGELGDMDLWTLRDDPIIKKLQKDV